MGKHFTRFVGYFSFDRLNGWWMTVPREGSYIARLVSYIRDNESHRFPSHFCHCAVALRDTMCGAGQNSD